MSKYFRLENPWESRGWERPRAVSQCSKRKGRSGQTGCEGNSLGGWRVICYNLEGTLGFAFWGFGMDTKNSHPTDLSL